MHIGSAAVFTKGKTGRVRIADLFVFHRFTSGDYFEHQFLTDALSA
jgi:hypothetical protein